MHGVVVPVSARPEPRWPTMWWLAILTALVAIGLGAWWTSRSSLETELAEHGVDPATVVILDQETRVAVRPSGRSVEAFLFDFDLMAGWDAGAAGATDGLDDGAVIGMIGAGGEDGLNWSALLFGIGPEGTAMIQVEGHRAVGHVSDPSTGAFFIASREELGPEDLRYRLLDADGNVLFEGHGLAAADLH